MASPLLGTPGRGGFFGKKIAAKAISFTDRVLLFIGKPSLDH
jgi:hypothetical protein